MSQWKWNEVELEIDMEDYDFLQRYQEAFKKMEITEKEIQKTGENAEIIRLYCEMFYQLFDDIFGDGTGDKLFAGKKNARICEECYDSFIQACTECTAAANKRRADTIRKYSPNRAQRRARK